MDHHVIIYSPNTQQHPPDRSAMSSIEREHPSAAYPVLLIINIPSTPVKQPWEYC